MIEGNILVFFVCCICGRGMANADHIEFDTSLEYCYEHKPRPLVLNPENIRKVMADAMKFLRDHNNPDGGQNN
jgi:hypothetical protein